MSRSITRQAPRRATSWYQVTLLAFVGACLSVAVWAVGDAMRSQRPHFGSGFAVEDSASFRIGPPAALDDLTARSDVIADARLVRRVGERDVSFGQSRPLGEQQVVHDIIVTVVTYELEVANYIRGDGPDRIEVHVGPDLELIAPKVFTPGTKRLWFLEREEVYGFGGFGLYYGEFGVLSESRGVIHFGGDDRVPVEFLRGRTLSEVAGLVSAR